MGETLPKTIVFQLEVLIKGNLWQTRRWLIHQAILTETTFNIRRKPVHISISWCLLGISPNLPSLLNHHSAQQQTLFSFLYPGILKVALTASAILPLSHFSWSIVLSISSKLSDFNLLTLCTLDLLICWVLISSIDDFLSLKILTFWLLHTSATGVFDLLIFNS